MKKKIVLIILIFNINLIFSQKYSVIEYKVTFGEDDIYKNFGENEFNKLKKQVESESFSLEFSKNKSYFYNNQILDSENDSWNKIRKEYLKDKDSSFTYKINYSENLLIKIKRKTDWKITSESKYIDNILCYKAESTYTLNRPNKTFVFPIVAWFAPSIPFGFGPLGYGDLPGLILELQERNVNYGAVKINLESINDFKIPNFERYKKIDEAEFEKIILDRMKY
jgi:GLPGLI family protein